MRRDRSAIARAREVVVERDEIEVVGIEHPARTSRCVHENPRVIAIERHQRSLAIESVLDDKDAQHEEAPAGESERDCGLASETQAGSIFNTPLLIRDAAEAGKQVRLHWRG